VLQRLKLAAVSPRLLAVYRSGEMSLEQLMAFTISDDHGAQEAVWFERPFSDLSSQDIRNTLTAIRPKPLPPFKTRSAPSWPTAGCIASLCNRNARCAFGS